MVKRRYYSVLLMPGNLAQAYTPLLIHLLVALALAGVLLLLSSLVGQHLPTREKMQPYECGITPVGDAREPFDVKFYLVAMVFILFDVEAVFLYPWAYVYRELRWYGFTEMLVYIVILLAGYVYLWKKGALDWNPTSKRGSRNVTDVTEKPSGEQNPIVQTLREWDERAIAEVVEFRGELTLVIPRELLRQAAEYLQAEPGLRFDFLSDISAVDRFPIEPRFEVNYHLLSIPLRQTVRLRVWAPGSDPVVPTVVPVWPTANWHEREIFDLFGIRFEGHPDLRRILMPDDWEGYPLRKDYPVEGFR